MNVKAKEYKPTHGGYSGRVNKRNVFFHISEPVPEQLRRHFIDGVPKQTKEINFNELH